jgi:hypothetical protein
MKRIIHFPIALLWGSLLLAALVRTVTPSVLPVEIPGFRIPERLVTGVSIVVLGVLYWYIGRQKRWALVVFTLYYLASLYFSLQLAFYLLATVGIFSFVYSLQILLQGLALVLVWRKTLLQRY